MRDLDCIVVGAGLIGLLCAYELSREGRAVALVERAEAGRGASWAGAGILSPLHPWRALAELSPLIEWSQRHYAEYACELAELSGIDPEWRRSGLMVLDAEEYEAALAWGRRSGRAVRLLGPQAAQAVEPGLGRQEDACLWFPEVAQVRNPRLLKALRAALQRLGALVFEHCPARALLFERNRVAGVRTAQGTLAAPVVIVASGAWAPELAGDLGVRLDISPVRGQMLLYQAAPGLVRRLLVRGVQYVVPRGDGHILVGSTAENVGFDPSTTEDAQRSLREAAVAMVPALGGLPVLRHWAGLRPGSRDGIPLIGEHPRVSGLYLNTGHHRNGILLAPGSARLLRELVLGQPPSVPPGAFQVGTRAAA